MTASTDLQPQAPVAPEIAISGAMRVCQLLLGHVLCAAMVSASRWHRWEADITSRPSGWCWRASALAQREPPRSAASSTVVCTGI